jgi:hypothetical protein
LVESLTYDSALELAMPPNSPPVAHNDTDSVFEYNSTSGNVLGNDTDPDFNALHVSAGVGTIAGAKGTLTLNLDGQGNQTIDFTSTTIAISRASRPRHRHPRSRISISRF